MQIEKDYLMSLIKHSKLQPWQKDLLYSFMAAQEAQTGLVVYGRQCGKTALKNEYIRLIGQIMEELQDQSETKKC
jgi:hypothetical protein